MALTAGSISQVARTSASVSLQAFAPTGGTGGITYQWFRDTISNFVPGSSNSVVGASSITLTDLGLSPVTQYYYKQLQSDMGGTGSTVTTSQLAVLTLDNESNLPITTFVQVSLAAQNLGVGAYNTSNLAMFSNETPNDSFGDLGYKIYLSPTDGATDFGSSSITAGMMNAVFSQQPNILAGGGYLVVILLESAETLAAAITRTVGLVEYFGILVTSVLSQADLLAAAAVIEPLNKLGAFVGISASDVAVGGKLDLLRSGGFTQSRGLYYGSPNYLNFPAAYLGRGLSVNFSGSNTTLNMNAKTLQGLQPDSSMSPSLLLLCGAAGADIYASFQGVPKVKASGENDYFDNVYNAEWFSGAIQVAGFNVLATSNTKVAQTDAGVSTLTNAYRQVCEQARANQYIAPGTWTSPDTFGNQADFLLNIQQYGYYIYSQPLSQQSPVDRAAHKSPLVQIALKLAGAIDSSMVIIFVNP